MMQRRGDAETQRKEGGWRFIKALLRTSAPLRLCVLLFIAVTGPLRAKAPTTLPPRVPLEPGEGLALGPFKDGDKKHGEADREFPMGSLAKLVWLRLEGTEWAARDVRFVCKGSWEGVPCWKREGHGKVDLGKALQESCNLAFLAWARMSVQRWAEESGEGSVSVRLEEAFRPFLGNRMPGGDGVPKLDQAWVGDGALLRTTPTAMLAWMEEPAQEGLHSLCLRYLGNILQDPIGSWWIKTGTAPVIGDPGATSAWVVGGNGMGFAVLHLPRGRGKAEGVARFKAVMGLR